MCGLGFRVESRRPWYRNFCTVLKHSAGIRQEMGGEGIFPGDFKQFWVEGTLVLKGEHRQ